MLSALYIKNFAIIDEIRLELNAGFTVITGETGAGKSIIIGALSKLLGERADGKILLNTEEKCVLEAHFQLELHKELENYLISHEFDLYEGEIILRREILPNGKSRSFINDTPCKLQDLKFVSSFLIHLHQQFDSLDLQNNEEQLLYIDAFAGLQNKTQHYSQLFRNWKILQNEIDNLQKELEAKEKEKDYLQFLLNEMEALQLRNGDIELWQQEWNILDNAEIIKNTLLQADVLLQEQEVNIIQQVQTLKQWLQNEPIPSAIGQQFAHRVQSVYEELKDIANELQRSANTIEHNDERKIILAEKLDLANKLLLKHRVSTSAELIQLEKNWAEQLSSIDSDANMLKNKNEKSNKERKELEKIANEISESRKQHLAKFTKAIETNLQHLAMETARVRITQKDIPLNQFGKDEIEFLFDANNTAHFLAIEKVASGGELSRLMLSIKEVIMQKIYLPSLIFDEIDTGISGDTAKKMADMLQKISRKNQLICISHLPQIAAKANQHLFVYKEQSKKHFSTSSIKKLSDNERVEVLATMLSGNNPSETAKKAAKELM